MEKTLCRDLVLISIEQVHVVEQEKELVSHTPRWMWELGMWHNFSSERDMRNIDIFGDSQIIINAINMINLVKNHLVIRSLAHIHVLLCGFKMFDASDDVCCIPHQACPKNYAW